LGAALQQAATERDYFVRAVVVAGQPGRTPRLSYRDRQYGYEFSSFNRKRGLPPIRLILVEEPDVGSPSAPSSRRYRATTFEEALPGVQRRRLHARSRRSLPRRRVTPVSCHDRFEIGGSQPW